MGIIQGKMNDWKKKNSTVLEKTTTRGRERKKIDRHRRFEKKIIKGITN